MYPDYNEILTLQNIIIFSIVLGAAYITLHVLQGIGLYTIAKRAGMKNKWMAFIPFFNSFYLGEIAGKCSLFGFPVKRAGLWLAFTELAVFALTILQIVCEVQLFAYVTNGVYVGIPNELMWAFWVDSILRLLLPIISLGLDIFLLTVLFHFFRKYATRYALVFTLLSIFLPVILLSALVPVHGLFIFLSRNNAPVDYDRIIQEQRERYYRQQQQYNNPYQSPYQGYQRPPYNPPRNDDPFEEFSNDDTKKKGSSHPDNDDFFGSNQTK